MRVALAIRKTCGSYSVPESECRRNTSDPIFTAIRRASSRVSNLAADRSGEMPSAIKPPRLQRLPVRRAKLKLGFRAWCALLVSRANRNTLLGAPTNYFRQPRDVRRDPSRLRRRQVELLVVTVSLYIVPSCRLRESRSPVRVKRQRKMPPAGILLADLNFFGLNACHAPRATARQRR